MRVVDPDLGNTEKVERDNRFQAIFSAIDEGFCLCEIVLDASGNAVDYRFLEVNRLFESMTGLVDAVGRTAMELVPNLEQHWVDTYAKVADGESMRFESGSEAMGRWFDVFAMPVEPRGRFAIVFRDVTDRKRAIDALEAAAARDAFRADLAAALRPVDEPVVAQEQAIRLLGEHLAVDATIYGVVAGDPDYETITVSAEWRLGTGPSLLGTHSLSDFGPFVAPTFARGEALVMSDVAVAGLTDAERAAYEAFSVPPDVEASGQRFRGPPDVVSGQRDPFEDFVRLVSHSTSCFTCLIAVFGIGGAARLARVRATDPAIAAATPSPPAATRAAAQVGITVANPSTTAATRAPTIPSATTIIRPAAMAAPTIPRARAAVSTFRSSTSARTSDDIRRASVSKSSAVDCRVRNESSIVGTWISCGVAIGSRCPHRPYPKRQRPSR